MTVWISSNREKLRFETDLEKKFHKIVSAMNYGDAIRVETEVSSKEDEEAIIKAIKKSEMYNCMNLSYRFDKEKASILITVELG